MGTTLVRITSERSQLLTIALGVQIQEGVFKHNPRAVKKLNKFLEVLSELCRSQESAYNIRDSTRQSHIARAKLCSKLIKYPNVEDYKVARFTRITCLFPAHHILSWHSWSMTRSSFTWLASISVTFAISMLLSRT